MTWHEKVRIRERGEALPIWKPETGEHLVEVIEEPDGPTATRYGERLVFTIRLLHDGTKLRWFVPYREEVGEGSLLGQLAKIAEEHRGLRNLKLRVVVTGRGSNRRYSVEVLGEV